MFALFERLLPPTASPVRPEPPAGLIAFYWHFAQQAKGLLGGLFAVGFVVALLDSTVPVFFGRVVTLIAETAPRELFATAWPTLLGIAFVEQGRHADLLHLGGHYAALWRRQSGGFIDAGEVPVVPS